MHYIYWTGWATVYGSGVTNYCIKTLTIQVKVKRPELTLFPLRANWVVEGRFRALKVRIQSPIIY